MRDGCPFCDYAGPSPILREYLGGDVIVIEPINPVVPGHVLVIPREHADDFTEGPDFILASTVTAARWYAAEMMADCNLITSKGEAATQTVGHLHVHLVPRQEGDGLMLPWSGEGTALP